MSRLIWILQYPDFSLCIHGMIKLGRNIFFKNCRRTFCRLLFGALRVKIVVQLSDTIKEIRNRAALKAPEINVG